MYASCGVNHNLNLLDKFVKNRLFAIVNKHYASVCDACDACGAIGMMAVDMDYRKEKKKEGFESSECVAFEAKIQRQ